MFGSGGQLSLHNSRAVTGGALGKARGYGSRRPVAALWLHLNVAAADGRDDRDDEDEDTEHRDKSD